MNKGNKDLKEENKLSDEIKEATDEKVEREETKTTETTEATETTENKENNEEKDNRSLGEKIDDGMDEVVGSVQDFFYGPRGSMDEDIPATMPDPDNEIRHVNKVQTRRNFNKLLFGKKGGIIFLIIFAIMLVIGFIVSKIG